MERYISAAIDNLADAAERCQPFSAEARQLDAVVKMLEQIDTQAESVHTIVNTHRLRLPVSW